MGVRFYDVLVFGVGKNLLFQSVLGHCGQSGYQVSNLGVNNRN